MGAGARASLRCSLALSPSQTLAQASRRPRRPPYSSTTRSTTTRYVHMFRRHTRNRRAALCCALARRAECRPLVIWRVVSYSTRHWLVPLKACVLSTTGPADEPERRVRAVFSCLSARFPHPLRQPGWLRGPRLVVKPNACAPQTSVRPDHRFLRNGISQWRWLPEAAGRESNYLQQNLDCEGAGSQGR